jgi:hypothetical protein
MPDFGVSKDDLETPAGRKAFLSKISPERAVVRPLHVKLVEIFRHEMEFRRALDEGSVSDDADYFESIYHCGLLLYLVGDPADAPLIWEGKYINMDTGFGLDGQFLLGAGVDATIRYLRMNGRLEIADFLSDLELAQNDLEEWEYSKIEYFYPE